MLVANQRARTFVWDVHCILCLSLQSFRVLLLLVKRNLCLFVAGNEKLAFSSCLLEDVSWVIQCILLFEKKKWGAVSPALFYKQPTARKVSIPCLNRSLEFWNQILFNLRTGSNLHALELEFGFWTSPICKQPRVPRFQSPVVPALKSKIEF